MVRKYFIVITALFVGSAVVLYLFAGRLNALLLLALSILQIGCSAALLLLSGSKNRDMHMSEWKRMFCGSVILFSIYTVFQNFFFLRGARAGQILENSAFINSSYIVETLNSPIKNTLTGILLCALAHWLILQLLEKRTRT